MSVALSPAVGEAGLRLWLPAVHTLSQNRTKGRHWSQSYQARKHEAAALLEAMGQASESHWPGQAMLREACRVLGLLAMGQDARKIRKPSFTRTEGAGRLVIVYTRVTTRPLDAENWSGSVPQASQCGHRIGLPKSERWHCCYSTASPSVSASRLGP